MKRSTAALCLSCATLGVASALATTLVLARRGEKPAPSPASSPPLARVEVDQVMRRTLEQLVTAQGEFELRIKSLETRAPQPAAREPVGGLLTRSEFDAFATEVRKALAERVARIPDSEEFKKQYSGLLVDLQHEQAVSKVRRYQEGRRARLDAELGKMTEWLRLSSYQAGEMRDALSSQYGREDEQIRLWEEGADDEELSERKRSDGEQFSEDLARVLTPQQIELFWAGPGEQGKE